MNLGFSKATEQIVVFMWQSTSESLLDWIPNTPTGRKPDVGVNQPSIQLKTQ